jgi:hypothetical protein
MQRDYIAAARTILVSVCDNWLASDDIKIPTNFYAGIRSVRTGAIAASDDGDLSVARKNLVKVTRDLSANDWFEYQKRLNQSPASELKLLKRKYTTAGGSRSAALRTF